MLSSRWISSIRRMARRIFLRRRTFGLERIPEDTQKVRGVSTFGGSRYLEEMDWDIPQIIPRQSGRRKLWLTADEHYFHRKIMGYQNRPFSSLDEMNNSLVERHNDAVGDQDVVIHIGDFSFGRGEDFSRIAERLRGTHFFMDGSHDRAMREYFTQNHQWREGEGRFFLLPKLFEFTFGKTKVVLCHYAMESWWASHYPESSVHFHGHSHGRFTSAKQAIDVGVDTNDFRPYQVEEAIERARRKTGTGILP